MIPISMRSRPYFYLALGAAVAALPALAGAQTLLNTLALVNTFLNAAIGLMITLAIVVFFWGIIQYLAGGSEKKAEGLQIMLWGVVAIFVMVSIWGIIRLLQSTFRVTSTDPVVPKGIQVTTGVF
ncbi:hypothetical protein COU20_01160 [Candidatus Kaiserbacteria bacterium CG10_big_fil_rev_8_21_14_0_10_59_10]|uniref:Uncharacterized protein n=1 Tax=Candidatus Kaiserbacteria bacterium CG10_big_fil_rev_8_21_14_0_10_59_10 TaxID=1974612 RepID=A0A2H0U890_9BACT|nr:MAG: hypothetical protein COU20_01160 [Candidatus Kaiserbacteria bacterium CG10_big_fil_rev_8_21_14_0_10_59_10]